MSLNRKGKIKSAFKPCAWPIRPGFSRSVSGALKGNSNGDFYVLGGKSAKDEMKCFSQNTPRKSREGNQPFASWQSATKHT